MKKIVVFFLAALLVTGGVLLSGGEALALDPVSKGSGAIAINGYDAVAYFTEKKPRRGKRAHSFSWNGAIWLFRSKENRELFMSNPSQYAPQYGGYCAWAVSQGYTARTDPDAWTLYKGKLYLNYNKSVRRQWETDKAGNVRDGDKNWPKLLER
ncbi:MAG: hypothetical protein MI742_18025 [Desulfobacterales bacterium]|nr:hypothetical protein [Desulfobacterales bacterium]